ncbi:MAG: serine hydrolase [Salibacteraceae bacterium]|nr:serine hydrolase [Salibacteraceae bacterium]
MQKINQHHITLSVLLLIIGGLFISGSPKMTFQAKDEPFAPISIDAADSILSRMNEDERIAQMFIIRGENESAITPGGFIVSSFDQKIKYSSSNLKPFVGIDLTMPEARSPFFLSQELMASTGNIDAMRQYVQTMGASLAAHHMNFVIGPTLDLYENSENPYTNYQSFGENPADVSLFAQMYIQEMRNAGILTIAGSFPGLGSTERGFEIAPPMLFSKKRDYYSREFMPFKTVINDGLQAILMANATVPGLDSTSGVMASGSQNMNAILRNELGFKGLIWADILKDGSNTEINRSVMTQVLAGADLIIINDNLDKRIKEVNTAIKAGIIDQEFIDKKAKRIIQSKLWIAKSARKGSLQDSATASIEAELATRKLVELSITLLRNQNEMIPLKKLNTLKLAVISVSEKNQSDLAWNIHRYAPADVYTSNFNDLEKTYSDLAARINDYNLVIVMTESEGNLNRKRFGLSEHVQSVIERIAFATPIILVWNGNPNALINLNNTDRYEAIIETYQNTDYTSDLVTQSIFGGRAIQGNLKRKVKDLFEKETGIATQKIRLGYGIPEEVGIARKDLKKLDEIANKGIEEVAYPGCQVFFAKDGIVVVNNTYGYHHYEKDHRVKVDDLYDLASITKIAGSVAGLTKLNSLGLFELDSTLSYYFGQNVDTTEYATLTMREILAHQAGLAPFVPFYSKTLSKGSPKYDVYSLAQSEIYPNKVAREFYIRKGYEDVMFSQILNHPLSTEKKYKYSDIGYYFALRIIEMQSKMPMDMFLDSAIYRPLGLSTMTYKPLEKFDKSRITPTELDRDFRNQLIHGDVHDPGAAMLGGVGGHAGLFSNANDLGILMQMYLNSGNYGGEQLIDSTVLTDYIRCQFCDNENRRGAGFDKPLRDAGSGPTCGCTNKEAFGHQGFTGTVTWADPGENVVYVFLSNRVYPSANNKKLAELNIRTDMQQAFYDAVNKNRELVKNDSQN